MFISNVDKGSEKGFTLVELVVAMAIFGFMLIIVVLGFINVVRIHNQAVATNIAEDNVRVGMDELVRAVRTSNGVLPSAANTLCLTNTTSGGEIIYYVAAGILTRADSPSCVVPGTNLQAITSSIVSVTDFSGVVPPGNTVKPEVNLSLTVASNNGTTTGAGVSVACGPTSSDRTFCSVITLKSGAVPR
jgi:prepilin-type N-terminal cleavage/methylation domain-containing protein